MRKEKEMFDEAFKWLETNYENADFNKLAQEYAELSILKKFKGSQLWQKLLLDVIEHLEAKAKYEKSLVKDDRHEKGVSET